MPVLKSHIVLPFIMLAVSISASGQCPDRQILQQRLLFFRDSPTIAPPVSEQIKEMLGYEGAMKNCPYQFDSTHALLLQRMAVAYNKVADQARGINCIQQSIKITNSNQKNSASGSRQLIRSYYILHTLYDSLGRVAESMKALDSCIYYCVRLNTDFGICLYALRLKVEYLYDVGDYAKTTELASLAESILERNIPGVDSFGNAFTFLTWKANVLTATKQFNNADKLLADKVEKIFALGNETHLGTTYELLAEIRAGQGRYEESSFYYKLAFEKEKKSNAWLGCKQILNNWAYTLHFLYSKDYKKAIDLFRSANSFLAKHEKEFGKEPYEALNLYGNMGYAYSRLGKFDSAFQYFQMAFDQVNPGMKETDVLQGSFDDLNYKRINSVVSLLSEKADTYVRRFQEKKSASDLQEAIRIYKVTDQFLDRIRKSHSELLSKLFWRSDNKPLYGRAIEACFLNNDAKGAFYFFEKSRAVLLNDQLNDQLVFKEKDIVEQAQLKKRILAVELELKKTEKSSLQFASMEKNLFNLKMELAGLENKMRTEVPMYFENWKDTSEIDLERVQQRLLTTNDVLVELFSGDSALYMLIIDRSSAKVQRLNKSNFENLVGKFSFLIKKPHLLQQEFDQFIDVSHALYQFMFSNSGTQARRFIISPDDQFLPFEALVVSSEGGKPRYLLELSPISYTYSARYLIKGSSVKSESNDGKDFLVFAPVKFDSWTQLATLAGSDHSAANASKNFNTVEEYIGQDALKAKFLREYPRYKILQLYTHATASHAVGEPAIYFRDSVLLLSELIRSKQPFTKLVVLSACETGLGQVQQGEGVFSFNRAFAAVGIPAAVTTLWSVENESTYKITELFHKYLSEGMTTDSALQKAKIEFIKTASKEKSIPYYWAAPVLAGKTEVIDFKKGGQWNYWWGAGILALILMAYILRKNFKSTRVMAQNKA